MRNTELDIIEIKLVKSRIKQKQNDPINYPNTIRGNFAPYFTYPTSLLDINLAKNNGILCNGFQCNLGVITELAKGVSSRCIAISPISKKSSYTCY